MPNYTRLAISKAIYFVGLEIQTVILKIIGHKYTLVYKHVFCFSSNNLFCNFVITIWYVHASHGLAIIPPFDLPTN